MAPAIDVGSASELGDGATRKFQVRCGDGRREAFVIRWEGLLHAYVNRCCHIPMTLDWIENQFLSSDGRFLQCATHGALYEVESGLCVSGPPTGKALEALRVVVENDRILVTPPEPR